MTLTLTPHRRREPKRSLGIPTIPATRSDGGTADVSTVDTELPTYSTPRGPGGRAVRPHQVPPQDNVSRRSVHPRLREADLSPFRDDIVPGPSTPAYARLTRGTATPDHPRSPYSRECGADT